MDMDNNRWMNYVTNLPHSRGRRRIHCKQRDRDAGLIQYKYTQTHISSWQYPDKWHYVTQKVRPSQTVLITTEQALCNTSSHAQPVAFLSPCRMLLVYGNYPLARHESASVFCSAIVLPPVSQLILIIVSTSAIFQGYRLKVSVTLGPTHAVHSCEHSRLKFLQRVCTGRGDAMLYVNLVCFWQKSNNAATWQQSFIDCYIFLWITNWESPRQ